MLFIKKIEYILKLNISNVEDMTNIFEGCKLLLQSANFFYFNIRNIEKLKIEKSMFFDLYYKPKENNKEKVRILGETFLNNNKNKCKIIYKNLICELKEYFKDIDHFYNHKAPIKIIICLNNNNIDLSFMFLNVIH